MMNIVSRRGILGTIGALAMAKVPFPFKPKPHDIVIATEMPPAPTPGQADIPQIALGEMLYDKHGRAVAVIRDFRINREAIDVTNAGDQWREFKAGLFNAECTAEILFPFSAAIAKGEMMEFHRDRSESIVLRA